MTLNRRRALVTGGAGFLGSHLCERLLDIGYEVCAVDNFVTGRRANIRRLLNRPHFCAVEHDVVEPLNIEVDEIYNLASPASPLHYQLDPVQTTKTVVIGAITALDLAKRLNCKVLQASTSEIYGDPTISPQSEDYHGNVNPLGPRACYNEAKRCAETLFSDYRRQYAVRGKIARIFNTYGPHMSPYDGRVVSNFIVQALEGNDLTLYGDGSQTRAFCYVDDLVAGLISLMQSEDHFCGPVNFGNPEEISIKELAEVIIELTGSASGIIRKPMPQDDPLRRCPDISLAQQALDWRPVTPLLEGLKATIAHLDQTLRSERSSLNAE